MTDQLTFSLLGIVIYCLAFYRALETSVRSQAKLVHECACIAQQAVVQGRSGPRYSERVWFGTVCWHSPLFHTVPNRTVPEYCASVEWDISVCTCIYPEMTLDDFWLSVTLSCCMQFSGIPTWWVHGNSNFLVTSTITFQHSWTNYVQIDANLNVSHGSMHRWW